MTTVGDSWTYFVW